VDWGSEEGQAGVPADAPIVVPNDARELARDIEAWRREQRWQRRGRVVRRVFFTRRWREHGLSGPLVVAVLIAVALLGATISVSSPRVVHPVIPPVPLSLAAPLAAPGTAGGLLPDVRLSVRNPSAPSADLSAQLRDQRPGVVAMVEPGCPCGTALATLADQAAYHGMTVFLVMTRSQSSEVESLVDRLGRANISLMVDPDGAVLAAYAPRGLTVVPVHADGVTDAVVRNYSGSDALETELTALKQPGQPAARG
jgi:hypothetical protein